VEALVVLDRQVAELSSLLLVTSAVHHLELDIFKHQQLHPLVVASYS
jgi:hypothetical protein